MIDSFESLMNPMGLSTLYRLANPQEKGNIMKEMQLFQKFDDNGAGHLDKDTFCSSWKKLEESGDEEITSYLKEMYLLKDRKITVL